MGGMHWAWPCVFFLPVCAIVFGMPLGNVASVSWLGSRQLSAFMISTFHVGLRRVAACNITGHGYIG